MQRRVCKRWMDSRDRYASSSSVKTPSSGSRLRSLGRCRRAMALPRELAAKLGKPIRLLASNSQGEAFAALCAIKRLLESHGYSFHTLADHVENANGSGLSDADKQRIRSEIENARAIGYAEGVRAAESKQHAPAHSATPMERLNGARS